MLGKWPVQLDAHLEPDGPIPIDRDVAAGLSLLGASRRSRRGHSTPAPRATILPPCLTSNHGERNAIELLKLNNVVRHVRLGRLAVNATRHPDRR